MSQPNDSYHLSNASRQGQPWSQALLNQNWDRRLERLIEWRLWDRGWMLPIVLLVCLLPSLTVITTPLSFSGQALFALGSFLLALWFNRIEGRLVTHILILLSFLVSTRYLWWRTTESMGNIYTGDDYLDMFFASGLLAAEAYAYIVLLLGYFQVLWPLNRKPSPLPRELAEWPTVDIYIPTYNEPLKVVRPTILAALDIDWPKDRLRVYVLDDGKRQQFKEFCEEVGATHITRNNSRHAKAGNLNAAMSKTGGEYIAIFDCDHIPTRSFLQVAMGSFLQDPKLAMVQTPHHFFSPDPFERNLGTFRKVPNEGELFYGLLQDGNDFWDATFFCGSCAVLRRSALMEVGGIAVETVTEDAHTALKMHRRGWSTAYLNIAQAAGLATESLSAHVGQRIRWARGMAQIFRIDNPLLGRGLRLGQRLCYANAMLHFFYGLPRVVFMTAPLSYLFFEAHIINAGALVIAIYALPHIAHSSLTNSRIQGPYRHSFWAEVYETVLATYILGPTLLALINPKLGSFNVTAKGGMNEQEYFDRDIAQPYLVLLWLNLAGFAFGFLRAFKLNTHEVDTVVLNMMWTVYNLIIIGAALAVAWESKQVRRTIRIETAVSARVRVPDGPVAEASTIDISEGGVGLKLASALPLPPDSQVMVALIPERREVWMPAKVVRSRGDRLTLEFLPLSVEQERQLVYALFGRADAWVTWAAARPVDRIGESFRAVLDFGLSGAVRVVKIFFTNLKKAIMTFLLNLLPASLSRRVTGTLPAVLMVSAGLLLSPAAVRAQQEPETVQAAASTETPTNVRAESRVLSLQDLGAQKPIRLRGVTGETALPLSVRDDEVVSKARLRLKYSHSPALIMPLSHINVLVNNELAATIPLTTDSAEGNEKVIDIDPKLFVEYNQLGLQLIAHYTMDCEDPVHTTLWAIVSNKSVLELESRALELPRDLNLLPKPFFDARDSRKLTLPFVFAGTPGLEELDAAGVIASYFGALADYRGASYPTYVNRLPMGNAVVFVTGTRLPAGLSLPGDSSSSKIMLVANPRDPTASLLVIRAAAGEGLKIAARAMALGTQALAGSETAIREFTEPAARKAYDAPRWIPTDRPVRLGEIAKPWQLEAAGLYPDALRVPFHAPPDLFTWRSKGMKLGLKYRYTPTVGSKSTLNININNEFVEAIALSYSGEDKAAEQRIKLPFIAQYESVNEATVFVPDYKFSADNTLQFQYYFERKKEGACKDAVIDNLRGAIDQDSTIDLSPFPHYTALPELTLFANGGFPFTKFADLGQTAIVIPETLNPEEVESYLTIMGRIGNATGFPAYRFKLGRAGDIESFADNDILVFGAAGNQPLLERWADEMPMALVGGTTRLNVIGPIERARARWQGRDLGGAVDHAGRVILEAGRSLGAIMSFESPLSSKRTVVVMTAGDSKRLTEVTNLFTEPGKAQFVRGDLVLFNGGQINNYQLGSQYYVGSLPLLTKLRWIFSQQPLVLILLCALAALLLATVLYRVLRRMALVRKTGGGH
ncbi:MAG: UDP-forming cellulose synthase catalytic subunit [Stagnimonas sp.]|nr:UDP-forming cellulose synthase catalytic subunit [Stagnimonas sp.]